MSEIKRPTAWRRFVRTPRLDLKIVSHPTFKFAQYVYDTIDTQREHLRFVHVSHILTPEQIYDYLVSQIGLCANLEKMYYLVYLHKTGEFIGVISIHHIDFERGNGEFGAWLLREYVNQGYISEAIKILEDYFFGLGFHKLLWCAEDRNNASCHVALKNGYHRDGIDRDASFDTVGNYWRNYIVFSKLRSEWENEIRDGKPGNK